MLKGGNWTFPGTIARDDFTLLGQPTFFDPLAVVLLFLRPRIRIALNVLIIVSDVGRNFPETNS